MVRLTKNIGNVIDWKVKNHWKPIDNNGSPVNKNDYNATLSKTIGHSILPKKLQSLCSTNGQKFSPGCALPNLCYQLI